MDWRQSGAASWRRGHLVQSRRLPRQQMRQEKVLQGAHRAPNGAGAGWGWGKLVQLGHMREGQGPRTRGGLGWGGV